MSNFFIFTNMVSLITNISRSMLLLWNLHMLIKIEKSIIRIETLAKCPWTIICWWQKYHCFSDGGKQLNGVRSIFSRVALLCEQAAKISSPTFNQVFVYHSARLLSQQRMAIAVHDNVYLSNFCVNYHKSLLLLQDNFAFYL